MSSTFTIRFRIAAFVVLCLFILSGAATLIDFPTQVKRQPWVDVRAYGAKGNGSSDDTVAFQAALTALSSTGGTLYVAPGTYKITAQLNIIGNGTVWIRGAGKKSTTIYVSNTFSLASDGVFRWANATGLYEEAGGMQDLTNKFQQPDSTSISDIIHYPPAIYDAGTTHLTIERVNIIAAWDAITIPLSNGATVRDSNISAFHRGISADLTNDGLICDAVEFWFTGLTANQTTAYNAAANTAYYLGHVDGLAVSNNFILVTGKSFDMHLGGDGNGVTGYVTNTWLDTAGNMTIAGAEVHFSNIHASFVGSNIGMDITGGSQVDVTGFKFIAGGDMTNAMIRWLPSADTLPSGGGGVPYLKLSNGEINTEGLDIRSLLAQAFTTNRKPDLTVDGVTFSRSSTPTYTVPVIDVAAPSTGALRLLASKLYFTDLTTGSGTAFNLSSDDYHVISDSVGVGWGVTITGLTKTRWSDNNQGFVSNPNTGTATASGGAATLNTRRGTITSEALTTAAGAAYTLTLTDNVITSSSIINVTFANGTNTQGTLSLGEVTPGSGSATVVIRNIHASQALNGTIKINFTVQ